MSLSAPPISTGPLLDVGRVADGKPECSFRMGHKAEYQQLIQLGCDNKGRKPTVSPVARESQSGALKIETKS